MIPHDEPEYSQAELADISALADGSLEASRREAVQARIDEEPRMRELFERERLAVETLTQARTQDRASAALRARIDADRARASAPARRLRLGSAAALGVAVAALAAVLVLVLGQGAAPGAPSVSQAAALALRGPALAAPSPDQSNPKTLAVSVGTVPFPNYASALDARASGERSDRLSQRRAVTVYYTYTKGSGQVAYTIVDGPPLAWPSGWRAARGFVALKVGGRTVVTWRRGGHTCVLSARGVPLRQLLALAAWDPPTYRA
jgi:hypothetical protein